jgi:hypothetical protein
MDTCSKTQPDRPSTYRVSGDGIPITRIRSKAEV